MSRGYFHGNAKTDAEIDYAMEVGIGHFVIDGEDELRAVNDAASRRGIRQRVLLRITPGIDPHTYEAVATGKVDSKFGVAIETGQAYDFVKSALECASLEVTGYHCHVGSQVFDEDAGVYTATVHVMLDFVREMSEKLGYFPEYLNIGGGFGVRYVDSDPSVDIAAGIKRIAEYIQSYTDCYGIASPKILMEPGRSIVADAGMTVYTVQTIKHITGYKSYIAIDGGMTDNPRYALYGSAYTVYPTVKAECDLLCDLVGKCCESDDIIQPAITLPSSLSRGDRVAVATTGAYNYSMASNYNRVGRPAVIMIKNGEATIAVKRESLADMLSLDNI